MHATLVPDSGHLLPIFFIYGLSFFSLGLVVFAQSTNRSSFEIGRYMWLFAAFGFLHGASEWADMFLALGDSYWTPAMYAVIRNAGFCLNLSSFVLLMDFGISVSCLKMPSFVRARSVTRAFSGTFVAFVFLYGISTADHETWLLLSNILTRYVLAIPAAGLTAFGFYRKSKFSDIAELDHGSIRR